jgi:Tol biopolymer transport system component
MIANSPALSLAMTQQGFILGTAGYMSPEQASGQASDQRADIWAFGVVLFEMLTGKPLFSGESVPHVLADVLRTPPDWSRLPKNLHPRIRQLLERCLEKNARNRYHAIADVRVDIEKVLADPHGFEARVGGATTLPARSRWSRLGIGAALALAGAAIAAGIAWSLWPQRDREVTRFSIDAAGPIGNFDAIALSPDGRRLIYPANGQLYSQRLDQDEANAIPGTETAPQAFFSPDGDAIAFFTPTQLKAVGFGGETPRVLANVAPQGLVGAWSRDGRIFFGQGGGFPLLQVPAVGGQPDLFADLADYNDFDYPDVLPGEDWVLFSASATVGGWSAGDIVAQNVATGERKVVLSGGHFARYLPTGHLVFVSEGALYAVAFDAKRVETVGRPVPVMQGVRSDETSGNAQFAVARNGTLVYVPGGPTGGAQPAALVRVTRAGETSRLSTELRGYSAPRASPDGSRVAVEVKDSDPAARSQIWIMDLAAGGATQLTFEGDENRYPLWTADGREILFRSKRGETYAIYRKLADGSGDETRVLDGTEQLQATGVLPGDVLLYQDAGDGGLRDILTFDLAGGGPPKPFLATAADERGARVSPNGAWIVYVSSDSPTEPRVYARPYPSTSGGQRAVSDGTGLWPVWSPTGDEIYYLAPPPSGSLMAVAVAMTRTTLTPSKPRALFNFADKFSLDIRTLIVTSPYDVLPEGGALLGVASGVSNASVSPPGDASPSRVRVVLNWFEELERLVPTN